MATVDLSKIKPSEQYLKEAQQIATIKQAQKEANAKISGVNIKIDPNNIVSTKKSTGKKIAEKFGMSDFKDVASYAFKDIIVPGVKDFILDLISLMFFNEVREHSSRSRGRSYDREEYGRVRYGGYFRSSRDRDDSDRKRRSRDDIKYYEDDRDVDYRNLVVRYKEDADRIIRTLYTYIDEDQCATVAQLLDMFNIASRPIDNEWGWTSKRQIGKLHVRNGWLIDVTEAEEI